MADYELLLTFEEFVVPEVTKVVVLAIVSEELLVVVESLVVVELSEEVEVIA